MTELPCGRCTQSILQRHFLRSQELFIGGPENDYITLYDHHLFLNPAGGSCPALKKGSQVATISPLILPVPVAIPTSRSPQDPECGLHGI